MTTPLFHNLRRTPVDEAVALCDDAENLFCVAVQALG
jgi:hypothetical protein